jgi:ssDNA-binding Zn-finger/Zn-ribbon topoisomerase 1
MLWIIAAVVMMAIVLFLSARRSEKGKPAQEALPYQKAEALFTPAERSFLGVLHQAVGNNAAIFGKVRVADVVEPKAGLGRSVRQKAFNKISAKHFDFLVCDKEDLSVACAIELDDGSHNSKRRHERDEFLNGVCEAAGVPLIQVPAKSAYVISEVRNLLPRYLTVKNTPEPEPSQAPAIEKSENNGRFCPNCSATMVKRVAKNGKHAGKSFWACKAYPKCKTIEAITA